MLELVSFLITFKDCFQKKNKKKKHTYILTLTYIHIYIFVLKNPHKIDKNLKSLKSWEM